MNDQLTLFEEFDPFTGKKNKNRRFFLESISKCGIKGKPIHWAFQSKVDYDLENPNIANFFCVITITLQKKGIF